MSAREGGSRRRSHVDMPVAYAAVGASRAPDLLRFPPSGSTPYEESLRLGSGEERFVLASSILMTWGAQRGAGLHVEVVRRGTGGDYDGVTFGADGVAQVAAAREDTFAPDGEPYLTAGTTAMLTQQGGKPRRVLVVYTVDEGSRVGFAWGTGDELGAIGEQQFTVEHRTDGTVWAIARGFLVAPKNGLLGLKARADIRDAIDAVKQQLQALAPGAIAVEADAPESPAEQVPTEEPAAEVEPEVVPTNTQAAQVEDVTEHAEDVTEQVENATEQVENATEQVENATEQVENAAEDHHAPRNAHQRRPSRPSTGPAS